MLVRDINDSKSALEKIRNILNTFNYDRIYINTPIRPLSENYIQKVTFEVMDFAVFRYRRHID
jgi:wyosine [tRNA(Phe)-imidazoG37] synthetase (radical SAM superfamily)